MLTMGQIQFITGINDYEGLSLRQICKKTRHHFNTVKKYVDCDNNCLINTRKREKLAKQKCFQTLILKMAHGFSFAMFCVIT